MVVWKTPGALFGFLEGDHQGHCLKVYWKKVWGFILSCCCQSTPAVLFGGMDQVFLVVYIWE